MKNKTPAFVSKMKQIEELNESLKNEMENIDNKITEIKTTE